MEKQQDRIAKPHRHPFVSAELSQKYLYCFGLGVMAMGNMRAITEIRDHFEAMLTQIRLPMKQREQIIVDINHFFEFRLAEVVQHIQSKEERYCFILDLLQLYDLSLWSQDYCGEVLENYLQIFHFSHTERRFLKNFHEAAKREEIAKAIQEYEDFRLAGYEVSYTILTYFFPQFYLEDSYQDLIVHSGETVLIDKPTRIQGNVLVERGGSLLLYGAELRMRGMIQVEGGRLRMREAFVELENCSEAYWLLLKDTAVVQIEDTEVDCGLQCGFLTQNSGRLIMSRSRIVRTAGRRMISFSGFSANLQNCQFRHGKNGLLSVEGAARMCIEDCTFAMGEAEYGGAIYSESIGNVRIERCRFEQCKAKYLGAGIYFKYHKFGQLVKDCSCQECIPEEDAIFHTYSDDIEMRIR